MTAKIFLEHLKDKADHFCNMMASEGAIAHRESALNALLDVAHAYGVAVGREGFQVITDGEEAPPRWATQLVDRIRELEEDVGRIRCDLFPVGESALRPYVFAIDRAVNRCDSRLAEMGESLSVHLQAITHLKQIAGEPAWTKADLDALLERVTALEAHRADMEAVVARAAANGRNHREAHNRLVGRVEVLEQSLRGEDSVKAKRLAEEAIQLEAKLAAREERIRQMLLQAPDDILRAVADEPPF